MVVLWWVVCSGYSLLRSCPVVGWCDGILSDVFRCLYQPLVVCCFLFVPWFLFLVFLSFFVPHQLIPPTGTEYAHLTDMDKLTVRGIQNDIDHDILSHVVSKKKQRKQITTKQKQLEKMAGTYVSDLDDEEDDDDDDDDEMFQNAEATKKKKKKRRKGRPRSNILCLTSCMQGQISRYGDLIHGVQPANTVLGLHLCAAFCGRTIHQQTMERTLLQRRTSARKQQEDQEQREHRQSEEQENLNRQSSSNNEMTEVQRPVLPPRFQIKTETDEVYINHDNEIVYKNRYAQKDGQDALTRGLRADVLLCGIRK